MVERLDADSAPLGKFESAVPAALEKVGYD